MVKDCGINVHTDTNQNYLSGGKTDGGHPKHPESLPRSNNQTVRSCTIVSLILYDLVRSDEIIRKIIKPDRRISSYSKISVRSYKNLEILQYELIR